MRDPSFWKALNPSLHIDEVQDLGTRVIPWDQQNASACRDLLVQEGYVHIDITHWQIDLESLVRAMTRLRQQDLDPISVFVYDESWLLFYRLHDFLTAVLGPGYLRLPNFWAWHLDHTKSQSGWRPHRDHGRETLNPDGTPRSVTVWIPLTHSSPLNGCLYIVPASRDPTYNTEQENDWKFDLADIRALPAAPGSFLCWNQAVLHWGSRSSPLAQHDRMSLSMEFQQGAIPAMNEPTSSPDSFPQFDTRLSLIDQQIQQYKHIST